MKHLLLSLGLHLGLLLFLYHLPTFNFDLFKDQQKVTWIKLSKGTGEKNAKQPFKKTKDMPLSTVREQKEALSNKSKTAKNKKDVSSIKKPKETPVEADKRASPDGATNFEKNPEVKSKIDDALARMEEEMKKREVAMEAAQVPDDGGGQSPLGSLDAENSDLAAKIAEYGMKIKDLINRQWITTPKSFAEGQTLLTHIDLEITETGEILRVSTAKLSGDASFDASAKRAVERAAPFPPPPEEIRAEVLSEGFLIEFNPRSVVGGN